MGFSGGDFRILIESEIMKVTGVSGTTMTVARHQEGTSAAAHMSGTDVKHILTVGALDARDQNDLAAYDAYASRPAAGTPGRIFLPNDGLFLERDNGSIWEKFGPIWPMTPPAAADFGTWVNQGSATIADNKGAIFLSSGPATSGENLRCQVKAYPGAAFHGGHGPPVQCVGQRQHVWVLRPLHPGLRRRQDRGLRCRRQFEQLGDQGVNYNSATSVSGEATGWPSSRHCSDSPLIFLRYYDDLTTNRVFSVSHDGINWTQMLSIARPT